MKGWFRVQAKNPLSLPLRIMARTKSKSRRKQQSAKLRARRIRAAEQLLEDLRRNPLLAFTPAARKHGLDPRWVRRHYGLLLVKDSSGRIKPKLRRGRTKTLYIPSDTPGASVPVVTRKKSERRLIGEWMAALNAAGHNHWSRMRRFPKRQVIGGVRLATGPKEVQRILAALAEEDAPFEGLYRSVLGSR